MLVSVSFVCLIIISRRMLIFWLNTPINDPVMVNSTSQKVVSEFTYMGCSLTLDDDCVRRVNCKAVQSVRRMVILLRTVISRSEVIRIF